MVQVQTMFSIRVLAVLVDSNYTWNIAWNQAKQKDNYHIIFIFGFSLFVWFVWFFFLRDEFFSCCFMFFASTVEVPELRGAAPADDQSGLGDGARNFGTAPALRDETAAHPRRHGPEAQAATKLLKNNPTNSNNNNNRVPRPENDDKKMKIGVGGEAKLHRKRRKHLNQISSLARSVFRFFSFFLTFFFFCSLFFCVLS